jgi:hypothetical protein
LPFRKYSREVSATVNLPERADLIIVTGSWESFCPDVTVALKTLTEHDINRPGYLAIDFMHTEEAAEDIQKALQESGAAVRFDSILSGRETEGRLFAFARLGTPEAYESGSVPVLAHIHVPKCAGSSFRVLLERHFGSRHRRLYVNDTYFVYGQDELRNCLLQDPGTRAFSSHHVRAFPRWLAGRKMLYVTFLRDPIQQFVSYMTHIKKHYLGITSESLLNAVPQDAPRLSLREFARWLLTQDRDIPFRENHNMNFFSGSAAGAGRLEAAKMALNDFFFVGITERMDESLRRLRSLAEAEGLEFPAEPLSMENTSGEYRDDLSWINPADEVGSMLLRSLEKDYPLYEWAVARFEEGYWESHRPR